MSKKVKIIIFSVAILLILAFAGFVFKIKADNKELLVNGIRSEAYILDKHEQLVGKKRSPTHYYSMEISLFVKEDFTKKINDPKKTVATIDEKIDALFAESKERMGAPETYESITIKVNSDCYNKYKTGEKVKIVYLKDNLSEARIIEEIE